ncbi:MAG: hypothetical protein Kow0090_11220 [Myxococcota bacterium]
MPEQKKIHPKLDKLLNFEKISEGDIELPNGRDIEELISSRGAPRLFLSFYDEEMIRDALARYGALSRLARKGYSDIKIHLDTRNKNRERLIICNETFDYDHLLGEVTLTIGEYRAKEPYLAHLGARNFKMLYIQWLWLQDPNGKFTNERPALPGQARPGLGIGDTVIKMMEGLALRLSLEGLINIPEYLHNAVLYDRRFNFLNPETQGRLEALKRCLQKYTLAELSWGVELGCVSEARSGRRFSGLQEEQVFPMAKELHDYFISDYYRETVKRISDKTEYSFDFPKFLENYPLNPDFTPKTPPPPRSEPLID